MESDIRPGTPKRKRVLCIEDERFISELYVRALERGGYAVDAESDGQKGLEKAQTNHYDIILLDLMVPNVSGVDILHALRDRAQTPSLTAKIIIITNLEEREEVRKDIEQQADGYLIKAELTPRELVSILDKLA